MKMKSVILTVIAAIIFLMTPTQKANAAPAQTYNQGDAWAFSQQGCDRFNAGNYNGAWISFDSAIKINPNEYYFYYMRAACSGSMGRNKAAIEDLNSALNLAKTNEQKGACHYDMTIVYCNMGDLQATEFHLKAAATLGYGLAQSICNEYGIPY